ncbi:PEP-CTERM sorting domain-containing protein [Coraliomargarita sp. W4R53]
MKILVYLIPLSAIAIACTTTAQAFSDNFNRADVAATSDSSLIGPNWVNGATANTWAIDSNTAVLTPSTGGATAAFYNTSFIQSATDGDSSTVEADISLANANTWGGIAFNVQNNTDFYQFRIKANTSSYQLIKVSGDGGTGARSTSALLNSSNATTTFAVNTAYHLSVTSTVSGTSNIMNFSITAVGGSTVFNQSTTVTDSTSAYLGGYAGLTNGNEGGTYTFDNFSAIPEPSTYALLTGSLALAIVTIRRRS